MSLALWMFLCEKQSWRTSWNWLLRGSHYYVLSNLAKCLRFSWFSYKATAVNLASYIREMFKEHFLNKSAPSQIAGSCWNWRIPIWPPGLILPWQSKSWDKVNTFQSFHFNNFAVTLLLFFFYFSITFQLILSLFNQNKFIF